MGLTLKRAEEIVEPFPSFKILTGGDSFADVYEVGQVNRKNPEDPTRNLVDIEETFYRSGGAGNVARNIAALGAKSTLVTLTGADAYRQHLVRAAQTEGYDLITMSDHERSTIHKHRTVAEGKTTERRDYEKNGKAPMSESSLKELSSCFMELVPAVHGVLISDYAKGFLTEASAEVMLKVAKKAKVPVYVDVKPKNFPYIIGADVISPNFEEGREIVGDKIMSPDVVAERLSGTFCGEVFLTDGKDGMYYSNLGGKAKFYPQIHKANVSDTSGCGDTALVVIMLSRLAGATQEESAELANAAAAVVAEQVGAYAPTVEEVLRKLIST